MARGDLTLRKTIMITPEMQDRLWEMAQEEDRSEGAVIRRAIELYYGTTRPVTRELKLV